MQRSFVGKGGKYDFCNGRNKWNPFFYRSLELEDRFLVKHGLWEGESLPDIPDGAKVLEAADYDA